MRPDTPSRLSATFTRWLRLARLREWRDDLARAAARRTSPNTRLSVVQLEDRVVPSRPYPIPVIYAGVGTGPPPLVRAFEAETGELSFERLVAEETFTGGVRVAAADVNRDGYPDVVAGMGPGGGPRVTVLDGLTGDPLPGTLGSFYAYDPSFTGGVFVAADDVTGDYVPDIITAAGVGGSPHVKVFDGKTGVQIASYLAFAPDFRGGATVAAADFDRDGRAELAVGAGPGGGPHVKVFDPPDRDRRAVVLRVRHLLRGRGQRGRGHAHG